MDLQQMLDQAATGAVHVEEGWGQGRATYGGLVSGLMVAALRAHLPEGSDAGRLPLRAVTTSFVAPVAPGSADAEVTVLRSGSSATQGQVHLRQDGQVVAALLGSFGAPRQSGLTIAPAVTMPDLAAPDDALAVPYIPGQTPDFFRHVDLRLAEGGVPYTGSGISHVHGWMRFREAPPRFGEEHLVALVDAWPPAPIQMLTEPRPASTLTWTLEILGDPAAEPDAWWGYDVRTDHAGEGYAHTHAHVWRPDGTLVAVSRQTVAVFG